VVHARDGEEEVEETLRRAFGGGGHAAGGGHTVCRFFLVPRGTDLTSMYRLLSLIAADAAGDGVEECSLGHCLVTQSLPETTLALDAVLDAALADAAAVRGDVAPIAPTRDRAAAVAGAGRAWRALVGTCGGCEWNLRGEERVRTLRALARTATGGGSVRELAKSLWLMAPLSQDEALDVADRLLVDRLQQEVQ
jgi:hypothetical protein